MDFIKWLGITYFLYSCADNVCQCRGFRRSNVRTQNRNSTDTEPIYTGETGAVIFCGILLITILIVLAVLYKAGKLPCSKKKQLINQGFVMNPMTPVAPTMAACPGMIHSPPNGYHGGVPGGHSCGMRYLAGGAQIPSQVYYTGYKWSPHTNRTDHIKSLLNWFCKVLKL